MYTAQLTIERIQSLIKEKGTTQKKVLKECGINENTLIRMTDNKGMSSFYLAKIADYLGCSVDYLLGRTDDPKCSADTYVGENNSGIVQAHNGSAVVNTGTSDKRSTEVMEQFLTAFDKLKIEDKVEVMSFAMQKAKGGA